MERGSRCSAHLARSPPFQREDVCPLRVTAFCRRFTVVVRKVSLVVGSDDDSAINKRGNCINGIAMGNESADGQADL